MPSSSYGDSGGMCALLFDSLYRTRPPCRYHCPSAWKGLHWVYLAREGERPLKCLSTKTSRFWCYLNVAYTQDISFYEKYFSHSSTFTFRCFRILHFPCRWWTAHQLPQTLSCMQYPSGVGRCVVPPHTWACWA